MKLTQLLLFLTVYSSTALSSIHAQIIHVDENFNSGSLPTGWTNTAVSGTAVWQFGFDGSLTEPNTIFANNLDSTDLAYFDDDALGATSLNNTVRLTTPSFNNSSNSATFLSFEFNLRVFSSINDSFYVEVYDGANWNTIFSTDEDSCGRYTSIPCRISGFPKMLIDISAFADSNCAVRFTYHDGNDFGWYVGLDNVLIYSPANNDLGVNQINSPLLKSCLLSANELISCSITNFSPDTIHNYKVIADVDNGSQLVIDTIAQALLPYDSIQYTFTKGIDISLLKAYDLKVFTEFSADLNQVNDTSRLVIPSRLVKSMPYLEGFEDSTHEWTTSGANSSWERGVPANTQINQAASGIQAFVTNLTGNYNANEFSYLNSPCIELDTSINKYMVAVELNFNTEGFFDPLWLEYSTDGGNQWQKVERTTLPLGWYNIASQQVWGGNNSSWTNYSSIIDNPDQKLSIKFRFVFKSDNSNQFEGVGVDNFSLKPLKSKALKISNLLKPAKLPNYQCGLSKSETVQLRILNFGLNSVDSFKLAYQIDNSAPIRVNVLDTVSANEIFDYEFAVKADLYEYKTFEVKMYLEFIGDNGVEYDTLTQMVNNEYYVQKEVPYFEDFDGMSPITNYRNTSITPTDSLSIEWTRNPALIENMEHTWVIATDSAYNGLQGPWADHTGNNGNYLYNVNIGNNSNDSAYVTSPCIVLNSQNPELSFWYHRTNFFEPLYVDVFQDSIWDLLIDTLSDQNPANNSDPFLRNLIDLSNYSGKKVKIRFSMGIPLGSREMAIDDFHVFDSSIVTGLEPKTLEGKAFSLYPNPNNGEFTLSTKKEMLGSEFEVYNMSGQLVFNGTLTNQKMKLNLSDYGKGIYIIRLTRNNSAQRVVVH